MNTAPNPQTIDAGILTEPVRGKLNDPTAEITEMTLSPFDHSAVIVTTGGLYRFSGLARTSSGSVPWSIVLKVLRHTPEAQDPRFWRFWKRELLAFHSGILADIPGGVVAPQCYGTAEYPGDCAWIWLEDIDEVFPGRWPLERFEWAAYQLGIFSAAYSVRQTIPAHPWLAKGFYRSILADGGGWAKRMDPSSSESVWKNPIVIKAFSEPVKSRVLQLWSERTKYMDALERLPQTFCHHDANRRNLLIRQKADGQEELVLIDWAFPGPDAIGVELQNFVATTTFWFEAEPSRADEFERIVYPAYLKGLEHGGWDGNRRQVRLGYTAGMALWKGATLAGWPTFFSGSQPELVHQMFGRSLEEVIAGWIALNDFVFERVDEASALMRKGI
jgi:hypothetical protein